jgi:hypothetical protein
MFTKLLPSYLPLSQGREWLTDISGGAKERRLYDELPALVIPKYMM